MTSGQMPSTLQEPLSDSASMVISAEPSCSILPASSTTKTSYYNYPVIYRQTYMKDFITLLLKFGSRLKLKSCDREHTHKYFFHILENNDNKHQNKFKPYLLLKGEVQKCCSDMTRSMNTTPGNANRETVICSKMVVERNCTLVLTLWHSFTYSQF